LSLVVFYQKGMDRRNSDDLGRVREWLKIEFNSKMIDWCVSIEISNSTKDHEALATFLTRVTSLIENCEPAQGPSNRMDSWCGDFTSLNGGPEGDSDHTLTGRHDLRHSSV
jgi:hypothetical protein